VKPGQTLFETMGPDQPQVASGSYSMKTIEKIRCSWSEKCRILSYICYFFLVSSKSCKFPKCRFHRIPCY